MKTINKLTLLSLVTISSLSAVSIDSVGLHLGIGESSYSQDNKSGSIDLQLNEPSKSFFPALEIYSTFNGVFNNETLKPFVSYTYESNSDLKHQYLLAGINKYYPHNNITLNQELQKQRLNTLALFLQGLVSYINLIQKN